MAQQMAVKERNASDDGVGEIHHQIDISLNRHIDCIQPLRAFELNSVLGIDEEVYLMNVERMHLIGVVRDLPMMKCSDGYGCHWRVRRAVFFAVYVEALFVFGKMNNKVRSTVLHSRNDCW